MEFMTNLQGGVDERKPSLFELISEQQLADLLPPSIRYILALATHRHPRYLLRILNSFDELYALLMLAVERHFLKEYGGSFTENFYGLKRERVLQVKGGEIPRAQIGTPGIVRETLKLRESDIWKNLAVSVGFPYVKRKLDESYDIHVPQATLLGPNYGRDSLPQDPTLRQRILYYYKWFLRNVYPILNATYYFSLIAFNLAYLFDGSKYHSPFHWLIGTRMRRMGQADYRAIAALAEARTSGQQNVKPARPGQNNSIFNPRTFSQTVYPRVLSSLRILLPTSIFALKFLEWWHASDFARQLSRKAAEALELPPPIISGFPPPKMARPSSSSDNNKASSSSSSSPPSSSPTSASKNTGTSKTGAVAGKPNLKPPAPPISAISGLPIFTVPAPTPSTSHLCPICAKPIETVTTSPYGYVFCYVCIHRWVEGGHERQARFMEGGGEEERVWRAGEDGDEAVEEAERESRVGKWESGEGRCAVSGRRILGGTEGLRRVMV